MSNWIVVGSAENYEIARARGFDMFGFKDSRRREAASMEKGDKLIFYLIGIMKFGGIANVEGEAFVDATPVFKTEKKPNEQYSNRIPTSPDILLDEDQWLDVKEYPERLDLTRSRGEYWRLAFQGNLHKISDEDYKMISEAVDEARRVRS